MILISTSLINQQTSGLYISHNMTHTMDMKDFISIELPELPFLPSFILLSLLNLPGRDPEKLLSLSRPACSVYSLEFLAQ